MINENQRNFLSSLSPDELNRVVTIYPWEPRALEVSNKIISDIKNADPDLDVILTGSAALNIAGERDLDITGIRPVAEQNKHAQKLINLFGQPTGRGKSHVGWAFEKDGYHVTFYIGDLASPNAMAQKHIFEILMTNENLRKEYEQIKLTMDGKTYKEYQEAKYEFFNRVLNIN